MDGIDYYPLRQAMLKWRLTIKTQLIFARDIGSYDGGSSPPTDFNRCKAQRDEGDKNEKTHTNRN